MADRSRHEQSWGCDGHGRKHLSEAGVAQSGDVFRCRVAVRRVWECVSNVFKQGGKLSRKARSEKFAGNVEKRGIVTKEREAAKEASEVRRKDRGKSGGFSR